MASDLWARQPALLSAWTILLAFVVMLVAPALIRADTETLFALRNPSDSVSGTSTDYWDGSDWISFGEFTTGSNAYYHVQWGIGYVGAIAYYRGMLVVAGGFNTIDNATTVGIALWNPATGVFENFPGDLGISDTINPKTLFGQLGQVHCLLVMNDTLFVAGHFLYFNGVQVNNIASWNGETVSGLSAGLVYPRNGGIVYALAEFQGSLYASGSFLVTGTDVLGGAGGLQLNGIARWDGIQWYSLPGIGYEDDNGVVWWTTGTPLYRGLDGMAATNLVVREDVLLIAGGFCMVNPDNTEQALNGLVGWDGANWIPMATFGPDEDPNGLRSLILL